MKMRKVQNLLFILCIILSCVTSAVAEIHVSGYEGGQVKVSCPYGKGYESYEKYLCRNDCGNDDVFIKTTEAKKGRYSIHDDKQKGVFTATISDLSRRDAGKYWCGVTRNGKDIYTEVKLEVGQDSCCDRSTKVQSHEESSVSISCRYEPKHQNDLKYICRGNHPPTCLEKALITSDNTQNGQFRLTDEKMLRKFTVTITSLTQDNSGPYLCGVHGNTGLDVFSAFELKVKEWCCVKSNKLSGIVGRPVTLQCPYPSQHRHNRKFLCKGDYRNNCTDMVTSQSRFMLQEDVSSGSFLVTIREMKAGDAGTYWCGSDSQWSVGKYTKIQLSVEWCCVKSNKQSGIVGRPVTLQCPYPPQHSHNRKFLCKGDHRNNCTDMVTSQSRFKLQEDVSSGSFLVTIREMKAGDVGTYWCGSDSQWSAGNYTKIQLSVGTEWCCVKSNKQSGIVGHPVTLQCSYPPQHSHNRKFLCKGDHRNNCTDMVTSQSRFKLQDDVSSGSFLVTIREMKAGDVGTYWCGSDSQWSTGNYTKIQLSVEWCCVKSNKQSGIVGRPVTLQCPYPPQHSHNRKFLCKGDHRNNCTDMVTSQSRFKLQEDVSSGSFLVTIREMKAGDVGTYWCGSDSQWSAGNYTKIQLSVGTEWCCVKSNKQSGIVGHPVTLQCPYPPQHSHNRKFLCKGDHRNNCTDMVTTQSRFKLQDDVSSGSFLVTIREMKAGDVGTYWCGSDSQWSAGNYTKIQLSVGTVFPQQTSTVISTITVVEPVGSQSTHIPGKQIDDAAPFHPVVFIVPAVLLILTFALVMVFKYKCYKVRGAGANVNRNRTEAAQTEEEISVAEIYANQDIALSMQGSSKPQSASQHYDDAGETQQDSVYQNYTTTDDIYCNQVPIKANRR